MSMPELTRTTLDKAFDEETLLPISGIYILAYMGNVIYVGQAADISDRMRQHCTGLVAHPLPVDAWIRQMQFDYQNIRLDILETPPMAEDRFWLNETEAACIRQFRPLMNDRLNT